MYRTPSILTATLMLVATVSSCATPPDKIKPIDLPKDAYMSRSCSELTTEKARLEASIKSTTEVQQKAANADAAGMVFLGLPVSSMTGGDRGKDLAVYKGQLIAAERAMGAKGC